MEKKSVALGFELIKAINLTKGNLFCKVTLVSKDEQKINCKKDQQIKEFSALGSEE